MELDGSLQQDPIFRDQSEIYAALGGETALKLFTGISQGKNANEIIEEFIDTETPGWSSGDRAGGFEIRLQPVLDNMQDKKLIQSSSDGWQLTNYGQTWQRQIDSAMMSFNQMADEGMVAQSYFEADDGELVYTGEPTMGDVDHTLGFNVLNDAYPETLPAMYIMGEGVNDNEIPQEYGTALEKLSHLGFVEDVDWDQEGDFYAELSEVGERVYDEIVLDDRETIADHYGLST